MTWRYTMSLHLVHATHEVGYLAHILRLRHLASHRSKIAAQGTPEELQQHLEADASESWVITTPANLSARGTSING